MKKKIVIFAVLLISIVVLVSLYKIYSIPSGGEIYGNGSYRAVPINTKFNGLCFEYLIVDVKENKKITKIDVCEDNIKSIEKVGVNLEIITSRKNPFFVKNLETGEVIDLTKR